VNPPCSLNSPSTLSPPCVPPPFNGIFQSSKIFSQIFVGFELVDVRQNGIWFKLVNVDKHYNIIGTILYRPSHHFDISSVFFSAFWKLKNYVPREENLNFVILLNP
jgi:hypothetical protein